MVAPPRPLPFAPIQPAHKGNLLAQLRDIVGAVSKPPELNNRQKIEAFLKAAIEQLEAKKNLNQTEAKVKTLVKTAFNRLQKEPPPQG